MQEKKLFAGMNTNLIKNNIVGRCKRCNFLIREYPEIILKPDRNYTVVFDLTDGGVYCSYCFDKFKLK